MRSILTIAILSLLLSACGSQNDQSNNYTITTENGQAATVSIDQGSNSVSISTKEGTAHFSAGPGKETDLPAAIPAYPGAQMGMSMSGQGEEGKGLMVSMTTPDPPEKVVAFYTEKMTSAGLKPEASVKGSNGFTSLTGKGAEGTATIVTVIPGQGQTVISIMTGTEN